MGQIIALSLLLIVSVFSIIGFSKWYHSFESQVFNDIFGSNLSVSLSSNIENFSNGQVYFKNKFKNL